MSEGTEQVQGGAPEAPVIPSGMSSVLNALGGNSEIASYIEKQSAASAAGESAVQQQHISTDTGIKVAISQTDGSGTAEDPAAGESNNASETEAVKPNEAGSADGAGSADEEEDFIESPLFGTETTTVDLKSVEGITSLFKEKLGTESLDELPAKIDGLLQLKDQYEQASTQMANVQALFEQMPPELYQAIDLFAKGQDWKAPVSGSAIDYSKPVDTYPEKDLVNAMAPGKVTEAQWEEYQQEDCDPNVKALVSFAIESAKDKFESQSKQIKQASEEMVQRSAQQKAAFESSVEKSKAVFAEKWKDVDKTYLSQLEQDFKTGKIMSIFYQEDGTLRPDAYIRAAMARDGESLVEQSLKKLENRKQTIVNKEIINQTSNTPSGGTGASGGSRQDLRPELQTRLQEIKQIAPKTERRY
jgi:hypothetical protein